MRNALFHSMLSKATAWKGRNKRLINITSKLSRKMANASLESDHILRQLGLTQRLLYAYATRRYTHIPWKSMALLVAGIVYFIDPLDLVPDFIVGGGYIDDIGVLLWIGNSLAGELARFSNWESTQLQRL